jgi:hypothetical protein
MKSLKSLLVLSVSAVLLSTLAACGPTKYVITSTERAVGADAILLADRKEDQGQTALDFTVENLAPPDRVREGGQHFVMWFRKGEDAQWQRIGALDYNPDTRAGKSTASVPEVNFDFEVSAEENVDPTSPGEAIVFFQRVGG